MSDISQLKKSIRNILLEAGFIAVHFARASAVSDMRMKTWLKNGFHGMMIPIGLKMKKIFQGYFLGYQIEKRMMKYMMMR